MKTLQKQETQKHNGIYERSYCERNFLKTTAGKASKFGQESLLNMGQKTSSNVHGCQPYRNVRDTSRKRAPNTELQEAEKCLQQHPLFPLRYELRTSSIVKVVSYQHHGDRQ